MNRSIDLCWWISREQSSEVAFLLLLLHRAGGVVIDDASLTLGRRRQQHLLDHRGQGGGAALHRPAERIAAEGPEADAAQLRLLALEEREAVVVHHDQRAVPFD